MNERVAIFRGANLSEWTGAHRLRLEEAPKGMRNQVDKEDKGVREFKTRNIK